MSEKQGIEIDYCPQCRGIWLDRGELDKIIERSLKMDVQSVNSSSQHSYSDHNQYDYNKHKKKSWLNELFD
jgi:hypothetical protein